MHLRLNAIRAFNRGSGVWLGSFRMHHVTWLADQTPQ